MNWLKMITYFCFIIIINAQMPALLHKSSEFKKMDYFEGNWTGKFYSNPDQNQTDNGMLAKALFKWVLDGYHLEGWISVRRENRLNKMMMMWSYSTYKEKLLCVFVDDLRCSQTIYMGNFVNDSTIILKEEQITDESNKIQVTLKKKSKVLWEMEIGKFIGKKYYFTSKVVMKRNDI